MERTFAWLKSAGSITHESDYASTGTKGTSKKNTSKFPDFTVSGYKKLGTVSSIEYSYTNDGPLGIAINSFTNLHCMYS